MVHLAFHHLLIIPAIFACLGDVGMSDCLHCQNDSLWRAQPAEFVANGYHVDMHLLRAFKMAQNGLFSYFLGSSNINSSENLAEKTVDFLEFPLYITTKHNPLEHYPILDSFIT